MNMMKALPVLGVWLLVACEPSSVPSGRWTPEQIRVADECVKRLGTELKPLLAQGADKEGAVPRDLYDQYYKYHSAQVALNDRPGPGGSMSSRIEYGYYLDKCKSGDLFREYVKREDPAELRAKALDEWDNATRANTDDLRKRLQKASKRVETDSSGSVRVDAYHLKDGRIIYCTTKVFSTGAPNMKCDGDV